MYICIYIYIHGKNSFAERSKILAGYKLENNFVRILKIMNNAAKNFDITGTSLSVLDIRFF